MSPEASCEGKKGDAISGPCPVAAGHAVLLAEVSTSLFHCYSELLIVAESSVSSELWIMSQQPCGAKRCPHNKVSPTTIGHMNCDSICGCL